LDADAFLSKTSHKTEQAVNGQVNTRTLGQKVVAFLSSASSASGVPCFFSNCVSKRHDQHFDLNLVVVFVCKRAGVHDGHAELCFFK